MSASAVFLAAIQKATLEQSQPVLAATKKSFLDTFSGFVSTEDMIDLDQMFSAALSSKARQFLAPTLDEAAAAAREYEASLDAMATIGTQCEIVGKAKIGKFVRSFAHNLISGAFAVLGAGVQAAISLAFPIPIAGGILGAGVNSGLQHVVAYFLD